MIRLAVAGAGQWGRNHVRVLAQLRGVRLAWVIDPDPVRREAAAAIAPRAHVAADLEEALEDDGLDGLVVATPGPSHHGVAAAAIERGLHVLVEKPLATTGNDAWDLVRRARRRGVHLAVGHLLLHHPAVRALARAVRGASFGAIRYLHATRTNLGRLRRHEGALESLAPHDISIMVHLLGRWPTTVSARGARHVQPREPDVVFLTLGFPGGVLGQIHLSWLEPLKVRRLAVVGERAMAVFDDMLSERKLQVLHARIPPEPRVPGGPPDPQTRVGHPRHGAAEPLAVQLRAFVRSIRDGTHPLVGGEDGARVVRVVEAASRSLAEGGATQRLRIR